MRDLKKIRRHNVSLLMDSYGQAELSKLTGLAEGFLYQMSKGTGKNARGVNDENARLIEAGTTLEDGWLDVDRRELGANVIEVDVKAAKLRRAAAWPFKTIERLRFERLDEADRLRVEAAMIKAIVAIETDGPAPRASVRASRRR